MNWGSGKAKYYRFLMISSVESFLMYCYIKQNNLTRNLSCYIIVIVIKYIKLYNIVTIYIITQYCYSIHIIIQYCYIFVKD